MASVEDYLEETKQQHILEKDKKTSDLLLSIYKDTKDLLSCHPDKCLEKEIISRFPEHKESLETYLTDLQQHVYDGYQIVVAGQICSGKTSIINALLDFNMLPVGSLPTTRVVCRIRFSEKKKIEVFRKGNTWSDTFNIENETEQELIQKLKELIVSKYKSFENKNIEYVDIYWPIPFLRRNIIVVDTPVVGESGEMAERVTQYLSKAAAVIYVVDPSRKGLDGMA